MKASGNRLKETLLKSIDSVPGHKNGYQQASAALPVADQYQISAQGPHAAGRKGPVAIALPRTVKDQLGDHPRDDIVRGTFEPGVRLRVENIGSRFDVSTTPVREAMVSG